MDEEQLVEAEGEQGKGNAGGLRHVENHMEKFAAMAAVSTDWRYASTAGWFSP